MSLFIAVFAAAVIVIVVQTWYYGKHGFDNLVYTARFSAGEVCAGDDVYLYEEIENRGRLPLPYIKIDTELPDGLEFVLLESSIVPKENADAKTSKSGMKLSAGMSGSRDAKAPGTGIRRTKRTGSIQSMFVLKPYAKVRRRWRVYCRRRGDYALLGALVTGNDILGIQMHSKRIELPDSKGTHLTVLPCPESLAGNFASSKYLCGDAITNVCPVTDPVRICGSRDYETSDPMNRINWKSTAVHGHLMTNVEEKTVRHRFSVLFNMNSREIEAQPDRPSDEDAIERCAIVCASVLDRIAAEDVPVSLFINSDPLQIEGANAVSSDEVGGKVALCGPFKGRRDMIFALRTIAKLRMNISVPAEKMFDHIVMNPEFYSENENLIVITSYLDGRMANMSEALAKKGVHVIFYVTTSRNTMMSVPEELDVYYSLR